MSHFCSSISDPLLINLSFLLTQPTGVSAYVRNLLPCLVDLNPILLTPNSFSGFQCYSIANNMTPDQGSRGHLRRLLWTQFQLPHIYKQLRASLCFSPVPEMPLFTTCRCIIFVHDLIPLRHPNSLSSLTLYFQTCLRFVLEQSEHILCNSDATAGDLVDFFQIPVSKVTSVPLAHDSNHFQLQNLPIQNYFLYIGRQTPYKNLLRLIEAFAALPNRHNYELWIAGPLDRRYTPNLQAQAVHLGVDSHVKFLGYVPYKQLPILLNQAIALVFPSLWEGFGLPVLEAMACGTPVITSNCSSLPEIAGDAALLVDPYNVQAISAAMYTVATDSELRSQLRQAGLARASCFSWEKTGQQTVEVLQRYL